MAVIGAGPGGYVAAIRAAQLGLKTAIIEREKPGGICLNWGCIPTKALLSSAHLLQKIKSASEFGIEVQNARPDFSAIIARSRKVAEGMAGGVDYLIKKNKIVYISGQATLQNRHVISIQSGEGSQDIHADRIIVATGARARPFPEIAFNDTTIIDYRRAMTLETMPERLGIIGAGAIGVEFADFYAALGSKVTLMEALPAILPNEEAEVSQLLQRSFEKRGLTVIVGAKVASITDRTRSVVVQIEGQSALEFDCLLIATGITANTEGMGLQEAGVKLVRDRVEVNDHYQTSVASIYAIGDCIPGPALAHVASHEGILAAEAIKNSLGGKIDYTPLDYTKIPACTYCHPEVASVGYTEEKARALGMTVKVGRFPFSASGRARAQGESEGFIKLVATEPYGQIVGAHIIGPAATELISEVSLGMHWELLAENLGRTIHAHPTLAEGIMEAAAALGGEAINL